MNVILLHHAAPPVVGGVEAVMGNHARLMADAGHRVSIIAARGAQMDQRVPFVRLPEVDSRHEEVLSIKSELDAGSVPPEFPALTALLEQRLRTLLRGADWLIAHNVCSLNKNLPLTAALKNIAASSTSPRFILWQHDLAWTTPRYRSEMHDGYPWDLLRTDWPEATQVVVSASRRAELARLLRVSPGRIRVIPNGIDAPSFLGIGARAQALIHKLDLLAAAPLILLPVRITPRKNIEFGLKMLAVLRRTFPSARLLITGPLGPHNPENLNYHRSLLGERLELGLEGAAQFLTDAAGEPVPYEVIAELYRLADALFLPSMEEGFGIPILEAGLAGVPVFCSDIASLHELGGKNVEYFAPSGSPDHVAAEISSMLAASPRYALRRQVLTGYTWERIYANYIGPLLEGK